MYVVYAVVHDARSVCSNESMEWLKRNWQECCFCARCGSLYVCWELTGESQCSFAACFTSSVLLLLFVKKVKGLLVKIKRGGSALSGFKLFIL